MAFTTNYSTTAFHTDSFTSTEMANLIWIIANAQKAKYPLIIISTALCLLLLLYFLSRKHKCISQSLCIATMLSNCMKIFGAALVMISIGIPIALSSSEWLMIVLSTWMLLYTLIILSFLCKIAKKNNNKYITSQLFIHIKILSFLSIFMLGINCLHALFLFYERFSIHCYHFLFFACIPRAHLCISMHEFYASDDIIPLMNIILFALFALKLETLVSLIFTIRFCMAYSLGLPGICLLGAAPVLYIVLGVITGHVSVYISDSYQHCYSQSGFTYYIRPIVPCTRVKYNPT
eukprot:890430_1